MPATKPRHPAQQGLWLVGRSTRLQSGAPPRRSPTAAAAAIALPAGLITQDILVRDLAASVSMVLPLSFVHVLGATDLLLLALAGLGIAILGALGPAAWAATSKTTTTLRAE